LQHLGGIHSGCALSGVGWLILKVVNNFRHHSVNPDSILVIGAMTNIAVIVCAMSAIPWVRNTHHNVFERHHRFVGWLGLVLTWVFTILSDLYNPDTKTWDISVQHILRQQDFWFAMGMTTFILIPWLCVRKVPVDIELPSPKVAVIRFKRGMQQGLLGRISRTPVMEYHAFGIISEGTHAKYHYMICGVQGDFTRGLVSDPPRTLWTRELKFAGVSNTSTLYKRGVRICTGTGIGAALSTCIQSPDWYLIWIGSDQEKTFGPTITGLIHQHIGPERLLLWDSKLRGGRPDLMKIVKETYHTWGAEGDIVHSGALCTASLTCNYPLQLSSSRRITLVIQSSCRAAKKQAFPHSAHCGIFERRSAGVIFTLLMPSGTFLLQSVVDHARAPKSLLMRWWSRFSHTYGDTSLISPLTIE
jgi:hypothetical protein